MTDSPPGYPQPTSPSPYRLTAESIAERVAAHIASLKDKFPHLEKFSAAEHLSKNTDREGTVPPPGTVGNPELYSISYANGATRRVTPPIAGPKRQAEYDYDPKVGIQLNIHVFKGRSRGNDLSAPYQIGDLNVHVHVRGPAAEPIRAEIVRYLESMGAKLGQPATTPEAPAEPPRPAHPPTNVPGGDSSFDPTSPTVPALRPSDGNKPTAGVDLDRDPRSLLAPTAPESRPTDSAPADNGPGFSATKELVLSMNSNKFMLDFDSGETMDPPATTGRPEQGKMDVYTTQMQPYHYPTGLIGYSLQGREVKASDWNASVEDVRRALAGNIYALKSMDVGPEKNPTYFFKTRDGALGILQLVEVTDEPKGIHLRYKTVLANSAAKKPAPQNELSANQRETDELVPPSAPPTLPRPQHDTLTASQKPSSIELRLGYRETRPGLVEMKIAEGDEKVYVAPGAIATNADIASAEVIGDPSGQPAIQLTFKDEAAKRLTAATEEHQGKPLAILVEGKVLAAPIVRDALGSKAMISGKFTLVEARRIAALAVSMPNTTPNTTQHFPHNDNVNRITLSADGTLIAIANGNPTFILQTSGTSRLADNWKPSVEVLNADTGATVATLKLSTPEEDAVLAATESVFHFEVTALAFSPVEDVVAVGTSIGQVKFFNARTGELIRSLDDEKPRLADKETPENWKPLKRAVGRVESLAYSPFGGQLAVCGRSFTDFSDIFDRVERGGLGRSVTGPGRLKLFEVKTGALLHDLAGHSQVFDAQFSADGSILVSAGRWEDGNDHGNGVLVWNPETGEKLRTILIQANGGTHYVTFSPDKKLIATGSVQFDKENDTSSTAISVTYPLSGITEWQRTLPGWAKPLFTDEGKTLAVLSGRQSINLVNVDTGEIKKEPTAPFAPPGSRFNDFTVSHKARKLAVGGIDANRRGFVTVWSLGEESTAPP
jgi:WD40 repeat protein